MKHLPCDSLFQGQQRLERMFVTKTRDEVIYCGSCISEKMWIILQEMGDISQAIEIKCNSPGLTSTRPYILTSLMQWGENMRIDLLMFDVVGNLSLCGLRNLLSISPIVRVNKPDSLFSFLDRIVPIVSLLTSIDCFDNFQILT